MELRIDTREPIEIGDFVGQFTALANQYEKYVRDSAPALNSNAEFFITKIEHGSYIAHIIPDFLMQASMTAGVLVASISDAAGAVLVLEDFVTRWGGRLSKYFRKGGRDIDASKSDLNDFTQAVAAIARDPDAVASLSVAYYEDGKRKIKCGFKFDTPKARTAERQIEQHKAELDRKSSSDHERVLMVFVRSDIRSSDPGKRSGELVKIESISEKPRALVYASALAEDRIKYEIRDDSSVYRKGFVVDVNVETRDARPIAYRVTNLHQVIDLPEDDD